MFMRLLFAGLLSACVLPLSTQSIPAAGPTEAPESGMICKVYQVADLVIPITGTFAARTDDGKPAANRTHEDRLIQLICSTLSPHSWSSQGGPGSIEYFPLSMGLVVRHTPEMQEQVADLLAALRRLQDVEVSVELRFVTVSDECRTKLGIEDADGSKTSIARLDDAQVRLLLETAQDDSRTNVMQAPKLTVFNGQKATLDLTERQVFVTGAELVTTGERKMPHLHTKNVSTGLQVSVLPVVAPDNRTVTLQLGVNMTRADVPRLSASPIVVGKAPEENSGSAVTMVAPLEPCFSTRSFETTLKLTDGATALICGWTRHSEVRNQTCPPVLSRIPYIGQLFRTLSYGKEREHLMVLVTPRVIVLGDKEESAPPEGKPTIATELLPMPRPINTDSCVPAQYKAESVEEMQSSNAPAANPTVSPLDLWQQAMAAQRAGKVGEAIHWFHEVAITAAKSDPRTASMARQWVDYLLYGHQAYRADGGSAPLKTVSTSDEKQERTELERVQAPAPAPVNPPPTGARPGWRDTKTAMPAVSVPSRSISGQLPAGWVAFRGRLRLAGRAVEGVKTYVIEQNEQGYIHPVAYAAAGPGIDLGPQVGKVVEVWGPAVYRGDIRTSYVTVMRMLPEKVEE